MIYIYTYVCINFLVYVCQSKIVIYVFSGGCSLGQPLVSVRLLLSHQRAEEPVGQGWQLALSVSGKDALTQAIYVAEYDLNNSYVNLVVCINQILRLW